MSERCTTCGVITGQRSQLKCTCMVSCMVQNNYCNLCLCDAPNYCTCSSWPWICGRLLDMMTLAKWGHCWSRGPTLITNSTGVRSGVVCLRRLDALQYMKHAWLATWRSLELSLVVELILIKVMDFWAWLHFTGRVGEDIWRLWCTCHIMWNVVLVSVCQSRSVHS